MAVRHEVENLIRRGNIFYWRPRVPRTFRRCAADARLSLSLGASDHRKAQYLARRLNTRLAELKHGPTAGMTTKDQLAKLFAAERDSMTEELENVALMSRRNGRPDDIADVEMDLEHGYTYRLLEKWGVRRDLDFSEDRPGRRMLEQFGVPDPHIANIAANFRAEQKGCRTRGFENIIRRTMKEFEIPDTVPNRERAMMAFFGGRADALLDVEERYPLADRSTSALTGGRPPEPAEEAPAAAPPLADIDDDGTTVGDPEIVPAAPPGTPSSPAEEPPAAVHEIAGINESEPVSSEPDMDPEVPADDDVEGGDKLLPLGEFAEACEKMVKNKGDEWTKATANDARALVRIFIGILNEHDIQHSGQITQWHIGCLRQHFNDIPTGYGQSSRMRAMSTAELRQEALRMAEEAKASGKEPPKIGLGAATVRKHIGNLEHFLKHLRGNGYKVLSCVRGPAPEEAEAWHRTAPAVQAQAGGHQADFHDAGLHGVRQRAQARTSGRPRLPQQ